VNHFARYIPLDLSDYEAEPSEEQAAQLEMIATAQKALNDAYRTINVISMGRAAWPDAICETLDGISSLQADLENAQTEIFDSIEERDEAYEIAQSRNDERRHDDD
jgi:hypothetical protein